MLHEKVDYLFSLKVTKLNAYCTYMPCKAFQCPEYNTVCLTSNLQDLALYVRA